MLHHGEVVADDEVGEPELRAQVQQQVEDLRLYGDVEGRRRLVADHHPGAVDERPRDGDPLALAAGELVRIVVEEPARQAHQLHHLLRAPASGLPLSLHLEGQGDDAADGFAGVQGGVGVLEDGLDGPGDGEPVHRFDGPAIDLQAPRGRPEQSEEHPRERGLAAAGLADQGQHFAALHPEVDAVHGMQGPLRAHEPAGHHERPVHVPCFEDLPGHPAPSNRTASVSPIGSRQR